MRKRLAFAICLMATGCVTPPATCTIVKEAELPIAFTKDGRPVVDVQIQGRTEPMIVDTGAVVTTIFPSAVAALNLTHLTPTALVLNGLGGAQKNLPSTYLNIGLGGWTIMHTLSVINAPNEPSLMPSHVDGAIGSNMLKPFDIDLDLPEHRIGLYLPQNCVPDSSPPPWPPPYGTRSITFSSNSPESFIFIQLNGKTMPAVIDTGSNATVVPSSWLKLVGISPTTAAGEFAIKAGGYGPNRVKVVVEQFREIDIGMERFSKPWIAVSDHGGLPTALIGDDFLRRHRVFIANSTEIVYFGLTVPDKD